MNEKPKTQSPKVSFAVMCIVEQCADNVFKSADELFEANETECKKNGISSPRSMRSTLAYAKSNGLVKTQKQERNGKLVTCFGKI